MKTKGTISSNRISGRGFGLSLICAALTLLFMPVQADAQNVIQVAPGFGTLNTAVDDASAGDIFELERGGVYLLNGTVRNRVPITIRAAAGEGDRPFLQPGVTDGGDSAPPIRSDADIILQGLHITNEDELGLINVRVVRVSTAGVRVHIEDCRIDQDSQTMLRLDGADTKIYLYNNIISNMGQTTSMANGRVVDDRGNDIDTLVIHNNTMYNITSRIVSNLGTGVINFAEVSQNTMINIGQVIADFGFINTLLFKDNIIADYGFASFTWATDREVFGIYVDSLTTDQYQDIHIHNNNFYMRSATTDTYPSDVSVIPLFNPTAQAHIEARGYENTNIAEVLSFENGIPEPVAYLTDYFQDPNNPEPPALPQVADAELDLSYSTSSASYTAAKSGQPLGHLGWFGLTVSVDDDINQEAPQQVRLVGNYPNPFNPTTSIVFELDQSMDVTLEIMNTIGQVVDRIALGTLNSGQHAHQYNAMNLSSGVYLIRMQAGNTVQLHKMTLIK